MHGSDREPHWFRFWQTELQYNQRTCTLEDGLADTNLLSCRTTIPATCRPISGRYPKTYSAGLSPSTLDQFDSHLVRDPDECHTRSGEGIGWAFQKISSETSEPLEFSIQVVHIQAEML